MTPREQEVLTWIGHGKGNKEIAVLMIISETTVSEYRKRICRKLGLHSTGELVACAVGRLSGICHQGDQNASDPTVCRRSRKNV